MVFELPISTVPTAPMVSESPISKISIDPVPEVLFISIFPSPVSPPRIPCIAIAPDPDAIVRLLLPFIVLPKVTAPLPLLVSIVILAPKVAAPVTSKEPPVETLELRVTASAV